VWNVGKIAVFDSGLGSLSIIKAIQKRTRADIIYFADQKNFPYGKKSKSQLAKIIKNTINKLQQKFNPDIIVVGSNTPSLLLDKIISKDPRVIGVLPPLLEAQQLTKTNSIAMLVTSSVATSSALKIFIKRNQIKKIKIVKIDSSELVELVESGKFLYEPDSCGEKIISLLKRKFVTNNIDVVTLSSTHLPFLLTILQRSFPHIKFLDPADKVANQLASHGSFIPAKKNTLRIFSSGDISKFKTNLHKIGIRKPVEEINF
jgi:glutamate racemase